MSLESPAQSEVHFATGHLREAWFLDGRERKGRRKRKKERELASLSRLQRSMPDFEL
jgi:hypothetical protein